MYVGVGVFLDFPDLSSFLDCLVRFNCCWIVCRVDCGFPDSHLKVAETDFTGKISQSVPQNASSLQFGSESRSRSSSRAQYPRNYHQNRQEGTLFDSEEEDWRESL
jgi:hypothetical protein